MGKIMSNLASKFECFKNSSKYFYLDNHTHALYSPPLEASDHLNMAHTPSHSSMTHLKQN